MKKVDSRLKGHPGAETAALARALGAGRVLAAPAIPDMGRVQQGGWLSGAGIASPLDIATRFPGLDLLTPDISVPTDLDAVLATTDALPVGARGLAAALIRALWPGEPWRTAPPCPAQPLPAPALVVVGSRDPVTLAQVDRLRAARCIDWRAAPNGQLADRAPLRAKLALLQLTPGATPADPARAAADLARGALDLLAAGPVATLIATGGETAQALMAALGADRIVVTGMPLPGIARGLIAPAGRAPLHLVTKSGGFGQADTLMDLTAIIGTTETADGTPT
jgi:D-threonate/D-erythronate kinase